MINFDYYDEFKLVETIEKDNDVTGRVYLNRDYRLSIRKSPLGAGFIATKISGNRYIPSRIDLPLNRWDNPRKNIEIYYDYALELNGYEYEIMLNKLNEFSDTLEKIIELYEVMRDE